jgi:hypothetical protein
MVEAQVVCKDVSAGLIASVLSEKFPELNLVVEDRPRHVVFRLTQDQPSKAVLLEVRKHAYAYIRATCWERGGSTESVGSAVCICARGGEPLKPVSVRTRGERGNGRHALFASRNGLAVVEVSREDNRFVVQLTEHAMQEFALQTPIVLVEEEFSCSPEEFMEKLGVEHDGYKPVIRACIQKSRCMFCSHVHYERVEDDV